jgi:6-phosphogluconate dehydrogenase
MLMVKAGKPVDDFIEQLLPHLEPGDIIIDGGNSHFPDTIRRTKYVESKGLLYIGTGVSGGEEGRAEGPSIMPGGSPRLAARQADLPEDRAKVDGGEPCCDWVGENGAGHFVKMVHNGIEYGDMQMICETYQMMKHGLGMSNDEMHEVFAEWNKGELDSYLIEITRDILGYKDEEGNAVIDLILDTAGQKGTGKWTVHRGARPRQPLTLIGEAVFARCLSALKDERVAASKVLKGPEGRVQGATRSLPQRPAQALYASKIVSATPRATSSCARRRRRTRLEPQLRRHRLMWRGGCIIRSVFLGKIKEAFDKNPKLVNLLLDPFFKAAVTKASRLLAARGHRGGQARHPDAGHQRRAGLLRRLPHERLPANLLQAQRDYFGAHTYERVDKPRGEFFHTNWTGRASGTSARIRWGHPGGIWTSV